MSKFYLEPTKVTPMVVLDHQNGIFELRGISSPENSLGFYQQILAKLDEYLNSNPGSITANLYFLYFNTSSSKCLFDLLKKCTSLRSNGGNVTINWHYDEMDEDMKEVGEDFSDILNVPFNFIEEAMVA